MFALRSETGHHPILVDVLVMDEATAVRHNRLALLQHIAALTDGLADLSELEGF